MYCFCACATVITLSTIGAAIIAPENFKTESVLAGFGVATGVFGLAGGLAKNPTDQNKVEAQSVDNITMERQK